MNELGQKYSTAHAAHYTTKNLLEALELYRSIIDSDPDTAEAGYSRSQIQNIANAVVPKDKLFAAQVDLIVAHFEAPTETSSP